jgi:hypothetical protein
MVRVEHDRSSLLQSVLHPLKRDKTASANLFYAVAIGTAESADGLGWSIWPAGWCSTRLRVVTLLPLVYSIR